MRTIVVVGSEGQIGKEISRVHTIFPELNVLAYTKDELDITDKASITKRLLTDNPKFVINCSAYTDVVGAETNEKKANQINCEGVGYLAEACRMIGAALIHFSTDYIFDGTKDGYYTENDKPNPLNKYGMSKYKGEHEITRLLDNHFIIRTSWVYSHYEGNFVHSILNKMLQKKSIDVVNDQYGSPTSATDLALLALRICDIQSDKYGIYHFSSDSHINWCTFTDVIRKFATYYVYIDCTVKPISTKKLGPSVKRPYNVVLNCDKIKQTFTEIDLDFDWIKSLEESMFHRFKHTSIDNDYELQKLWMDDTSVALGKLYRKIANLEKRLENRD